MIFEKVYTGKVIGMKLVGGDELGNRYYEVEFKNNKKIFYQTHIKRNLPIAMEAIIRFTGDFIENSTPKLFKIDEVLDIEHLNQLHLQEYKCSQNTILERQ
jgi:hypothetical protein